MSTLGILQNTLVPNLAFHTSLALPAYAFGRATDTVEAKDYLWASAQVANVWYTSIGKRLALGVPLYTAVHTVTRPGWLIIAGVTLWGGRLTYRVVSRAIRRGKDDPRYDEVRKQPDGWNKVLWSMFLPEAVVQSFIALPFTAPFSTAYPVTHCPGEWIGLVDALAIGLFGVGFALETLADWQLERYKQSGKSGVCKEGVWSIVRHPNYLGDILIHLAFPMSLYANGLFNPLLLLGPVTNYLFLRYLGGDKQNEASQGERYAKDDPVKMVEFNVYKEEKNAVWPGVTEVGNKWTWAVLALGGAAVALERVVRAVQ